MVHERRQCVVCVLLYILRFFYVRTMVTSVDMDVEKKHVGMREEEVGYIYYEKEKKRKALEFFFFSLPSFFSFFFFHSFRRRI